MKVITFLNTILAFVIELIALGSFGYLGAILRDRQPVKTIAIIISLVVIMSIWGTFFSPKAAHRLEMPWLFIGKLIFLLMPAYLLLFERQFLWAALWTVIVILHLVVASIQKTI